jgi:hypothetical protein
MGRRERAESRWEVENGRNAESNPGRGRREEER